MGFMLRVSVAMGLLVTVVLLYWESRVKIKRKRMVTERIVVVVSIQVFVDISFGLCEGSED